MDKTCTSKDMERNRMKVLFRIQDGIRNLIIENQWRHAVNHMKSSKRSTPPKTKWDIIVKKGVSCFHQVTVFAFSNTIMLWCLGT